MLSLQIVVPSQIDTETPLAAEETPGLARFLELADNKESSTMWHGFDPEIRRQLATVKKLVNLRHQTPKKEWPLIFVEEHDALLVIRQWPDGSITAYTTSEKSSPDRSQDKPEP